MKKDIENSLRQNHEEFCYMDNNSKTVPIEEKVKTVDWYVKTSVVSRVEATPTHVAPEMFGEPVKTT